MILGICDRAGTADDIDNSEIVLTTGGDAVDDDVGDHQMGGVERRLSLSLLHFGLLDLRRESLSVFQKCWAVLRAGRTDSLAGRLLLGAQRVGRRDRRAAGDIGLEEQIHQRWVLAPAALRPAHPFWILAHQFQVDHALNPTFGHLSGHGTTP